MLDQAEVAAIEDRMPNHEKDRHVLAASVVGDIGLVVTSNVRHFPPTHLDRLGKRSVTPDRMLCELLSSEPTVVRHALRLQAGAMHTPRTWTEAGLLGLLGGLGHGDAQAPEFVRDAAARFGIPPAPPPSA
jgi:hypothetical protein